MAEGYIYVLANSSMPGLVKVGKTTRLPSERAGELSGVTGVATPFIVVFEEHFEDCDAVEEHVHTVLASNGLRVSQSREFFRAPVSDVVKIIATAGGRGSRQHLTPSTPIGLEGMLTPDDPEFEGLRLERRAGQEPWEDLMKEADRHYNGSDGYLEDHYEAFKLYRDAARLGCARAFERMGNMHRNGEGAPQDAHTALECYKEAVKRGFYPAYCGMVYLFVSEGHAENARKSLSKFIASGEADSWRTTGPITRIDSIKWILLHSQTRAQGQLTKAYGPHAAPYAKLANADLQLMFIAQDYLPQLRCMLQADLESGPAWCPTEDREVLGRQLFKLLNDTESWLNELRRSSKTDVTQVLREQLTNAVGSLLDRPFHFTCTCNHEFHETFGWIESHESITCPGCNATLVLDLKQRGMLTNLQATVTSVLNHLETLQQTIRDMAGDS